MDFISILVIALGLAMDAFAVALSVSLSLTTLTWRHFFRLSYHFGFFQFAMPILGWWAGKFASQWLHACDHWIAFGLLCILGIKMIREMRADTPVQLPDNARHDPTRGARLVLLSIATSIDALAVGLSFAMLGMAIIWPALIIGIVTAAITALGMFLGRLVGLRFTRYSRLVGGLLLIGIGVRILMEHLLNQV